MLNLVFELSVIIGGSVYSSKDLMSGYCLCMHWYQSKSHLGCAFRLCDCLVGGVIFFLKGGGGGLVWTSKEY